jgi:hypothetical protein
MPLGPAYEVLESPFTGSKSFLSYPPNGARTGVTMVGEFPSRSNPLAQPEAAIDRFLSAEFEPYRAELWERTKGS